MEIAFSIVLEKSKLAFRIVMILKNHLVHTQATSIH